MTGYSYFDKTHSYPFYDGSSVKGKTDVENLNVPALSSEKMPIPPELVAPAGVTLVTSYLRVPVRLSGVVSVRFRRVRR